MRYKERGIPKAAAEATLEASKAYVPVRTGYTRDSFRIIESHRTNENYYTLISANPGMVYDTVQKYPKGGRYEFKDSPYKPNKDKYEWFKRGWMDVKTEQLKGIRDKDYNKNE